MNRNQVIGMIVLIFGFSFIILSFQKGEGNAGIFVIFPFFYGSGIFALFRVLCIIFGIILFSLGQFINLINNEELGMKMEESYEYKPKLEKKMKSGCVILIGPIPIIFGSDTKTTNLVAVIGLIILIFVTIIWYF